MSNAPYLVERVVDFHVQNLLEELADLQEDHEEIWVALGEAEVDLQKEWSWYTYLIREDE